MDYSTLFRYKLQSRPLSDNENTLWGGENTCSQRRKKETNSTYTKFGTIYGQLAGYPTFEKEN